MSARVRTASLAVCAYPRLGAGPYCLVCACWEPYTRFAGTVEHIECACREGAASAGIASHFSHLHGQCSDVGLDGRGPHVATDTAVRECHEEQIHLIGAVQSRQGALMAVEDAHESQTICYASGTACACDVPCACARCTCLCTSCDVCCAVRESDVFHLGVRACWRHARFAVRLAKHHFHMCLCARTLRQHLLSAHVHDGCPVGVLVRASSGERSRLAQEEEETTIQLPNAIGPLNPEERPWHGPV